MKITWFGHSAYRIEIGSSVLMIDPFLTGNPVFKGDAAEAARGATHVLLTHGHDDHVGDTVDICKREGATLTANFEICMYLAGKGVENLDPANFGGEMYHDDFSVAMVPAWHSSSTIPEGGAPVYLGNPAGLVITPKNETGKTVYHMGDTSIFSDMALIDELYAPDIGIVPVGDRFTMGGRQAALACKRFFKFSTILPCHYGTFPIIEETAEKFVTEMNDDAVKVLKPGDALEF